MSSEYTPEFLLPHKPPMIVVGGLCECDPQAKSARAWAEFDENSIFYNATTHTIPAYLGIEMMAQTIGLLSGTYFREVLGKPPQMGFLLGTRDYRNHIPFFKPRERYFTSVEQIIFEELLGSFACKIRDSQDGLVAEAELNVFLANDDSMIEKFLESAKI
ncbi:MAG: hypothetical protein LUC17_02820 [Oscillospiraceae bacterium]|nr:hypothetical protein [Oscillospiraceae bacterium]